MRKDAIKLCSSRVEACGRFVLKRGDVSLQEFNKGIFDYLIATDDPAKRLEHEEGAAKPAPLPEPVPTRGRGRGKDKADQRKRKRASENDSEFGVIRGIDFQGVKTVINVDVPESVQVTPLHTHSGEGRCIPSCSSRR